MKNYFKLFLLFVGLALCLTSCQNEDVSTLSNENLATLNRDALYLKSLGFNVDSLLDLGENYLVEGDILIDKSDIPVDNRGAQLRQAYFHRLVDMDKVRNITVGFDSDMPTTGGGILWRSATMKALKEWNNVPNCIVNFVFTNSPNPDINISYSTEFKEAQMGTVVAVAKYPLRGGKPGDYITVNADYNHLSESKKIFALVHELGHTIGLMHNTDNFDEFLGYRIPGTPVSDFESVMNYLDDWKGFSKYDKIAICYLYPDNNIAKPMFSPILPLESGSYRDIRVTNYNSNFVYNWTANGAEIIKVSDNYVTIKVDNFYYDDGVVLTASIKTRLSEIKNVEYFEVRGKINGGPGLGER